MVIESGIIIFIGILLLVFKLKRQTVLIMLGKPLLTDLTAAAAAYILHFGTFTGVMAAAVAGLMVSALTTIGRKTVGWMFYQDGEWFYHVGLTDILKNKDS